MIRTGLARSKVETFLMRNGLLEYLESKNPPARELIDNLEYVKDYARPILVAIKQAASNRRERRHHDPLRHAEEVGSLCARLLPNHRLSDDEDSINEVEATVLLASAWVHQVGLSEPGAEDAYNIISARKVWDNETGKTHIAGLDVELASAIADVTRAHRDHVRTGSALVYTLRQGLKEQYWKGKRIRVPVLAALFRTAFLLDVLYRRDTSDLGPHAPSEMASVWIDQVPISNLSIVPERGVVTAVLSIAAESSELLRQGVQRWCTRVNSEFASQCMAILADFRLAYREALVTLPKEADEESEVEKAERALESFRKHAEQVLAMRHSLGTWELRTAGDNFPVLQRNLIDSQGQFVKLEITPSTRYPDEPPTAKAYPRISQLEFRETGYYVGGAILQWKDLVSRGHALIELCEELRYFESPGRTFAVHAKAAVQVARGVWTFTEGEESTQCCVTRMVEIEGTSHLVRLLSHPSYPSWPPRVEGLMELDTLLGANVVNAKNIVERWRELKNDSDAPLGTFMDWLDRSIDRMKGALPQ